MGSRLRAEHPLHGARLAGVPGQALRAVRAPRPEDHAQAARNFFVNSYVKARFLTHDPERIKSFDSDPLIARPIAVNILLALYETADRVVADARAITIPTELLISGADFVVHHGPQHRFFERLGTAIKERHVLPGFYHDTFGERERGLAVEKARSFISARFA